MIINYEHNLHLEKKGGGGQNEQWEKKAHWMWGLKLFEEVQNTHIILLYIYIIPP